MLRALELAELGWGRVAPNPLVGAVVLQDGRIVGEGYHAGPGGPHAEIVALEAAGPAAAGGTLCVTLEPCSHHGRTPPCTEAIMAAGVARVVYATADPHPLAAGGADALRQAGVAVASGVGREAALRLNAAFLWNATTGRPFVTLKTARSLDGMVTAARGRRTRITGAEAEAYAHRLRAGADAILVGAATARIDDPMLTVRSALDAGRAPLRVVLASAGGLDPDGRLARSAFEVPVLVVAATPPPPGPAAALARRGVDVEVVDAEVAGRPDPAATLALLARRGVTSVLIEGGVAIARAFLEASLGERYVEFVAPAWLGPHGLELEAAARPAPPAWRLAGTAALGRDMRLTWERTAAFDALRAAA